MSINILNLLSFKIEDEDSNTLNFIPIRKNQDTLITIKCQLFVDNDSINMMQEMPTNRIYLNASYRGSYIAHQFVEIPIQKMNLSNYIEAGFTFKVPYSVKSKQNGNTVKYIDLVLAYSNKPDGVAGIGESIRLGTFLKTTIPTSEVD